MKKLGILNSEIAKVLADLGHTDTICISDCGLPVPKDVKKIDLALKFGIPSFLDVLKELDKNMVYEKLILANEINDKNPDLLNEVEKLNSDVEKEFVSHEEFKKLTNHCKAIIRTGDNTAYANIILKAGVNFGLEE